MAIMRVVNTRKDDLSDNSLSEVPTNATELLSTGFLEGFFVQYVHSNGWLPGIIAGKRILCQCNSCKGQVALTLSNFEKHAGSGAKRPSNNIYFQNGRNLTQLVNIVRNTALVNVQTVIKSALDIVSSVTPDSQQAPDSITPRQLPIKRDLDPITESTVQEISCAKEEPPSTNLHGITGRAKRERSPTNSVHKSGHVKRARGRSLNIILDSEATEKYPGEDNNTPSSSKKAKEYLDNDSLSGQSNIDNIDNDPDYKFLSNIDSLWDFISQL